MRKQYFHWMLAAFGIVGIAYGTHLTIYHYSKGNGIHVPSLIMLIAGVVAFSLFLFLFIADRIAKTKKIDAASASTIIEEEAPRIEEEQEETKPSPKIKPEEENVPKPNRSIYDREPSRGYRYEGSRSYSTIYIKKVGYGPVLRIEGNRIIDMRSNTYYRIENQSVMQDGYGIRYEIRGNQIRDAFGPYLYEYSGANINKIYGGFFASVSGSCITLYDLSEKYEMTDDLSRKQVLVVAALLFGNQ